MRSLPGFSTGTTQAVSHATGISPVAHTSLKRSSKPPSRSVGRLRSIRLVTRSGPAAHLGRSADKAVWSSRSVNGASRGHVGVAPTGVVRFPAFPAE